ncbi:MAG: hypothetical protein KGJ58_02175 [Patescibacteria group bacterium]|nr:hypothetical protein [Patescibacteria group bacterium]MDE2218234.1 hypothetical protein [Patescibacteria group bacterium]
MKKERLPLQSVLFSLTECSSALAALDEVNRLHIQIRGMNLLERENLVLRPEIVVTLVGGIRDCFCVRIANLFDKRKDIHSLKKYYKGDAIDKLEKHPIIVAAIKARHNNIAHIGKAYTKWPDIDAILAATDLKDLLENIRIGILINR